MVPEGEFGPEDSNALQTSTLPDEEMVEVSLLRHLVDIKHLLAQM